MRLTRTKEPRRSECTVTLEARRVVSESSAFRPKFVDQLPTCWRINFQTKKKPKREDNAIALPIYDNQGKNDVAEELALLQELLHLAVNNDTNLVSRGCIEGLESARVQAKSLLLEGGARAIAGILKLNALDDALIVCNLSPGGSADLLAVTWFLGRFDEP